MSRAISITLYLLLGVSALLGILFYVGSVESAVLIYWCYVLFALGAAAAVIFSLVNITKNPKAARGLLIGLLALGVIIGITYATSSGDDANTIYEDLNITESTSHGVGMGLATFYILGALTIVSIIYVEISRLFK